LRLEKSIQNQNSAAGVSLVFIFHGQAEKMMKVASIKRKQMTINQSYLVSKYVQRQFGAPEVKPG
jgi:hypothetical protein